jgi:hypothetical protein
MKMPAFAGISFLTRSGGETCVTPTEDPEGSYFFLAAFFLALAFAFFLALAMIYLQLRVSPRVSIYTRL